MRQKIGGPLAALGIALAALSGVPLVETLGLALLLLVVGLIITGAGVTYGMSGMTRREKAMRDLQDTKTRHALVNEDTDLLAEVALAESKQSERLYLLSVAENYDDELRARLIEGEMAPVRARISAINNRRAEIAIELGILDQA